MDAKWVAVVFGVGAIPYSVFTAYELGVLHILPMSLHLVLDGAAGVLLSASPFLLRFSDQVILPHLLFGLFAIAASFMTHMDVTLSTGHHKPI